VPRKAASTALVVQHEAEDKILTFRRKHVILDSDLAEFYGVPTGRLNEQAKNNPARFPSDFRFQLTPKEATSLLSDNPIAKGRGGRTSPPWVYTEQGALQAAGVLKSPKADEVSVAISRAFVTMRDRLSDLAELSRALPEILERVEAIEGDVAMLAGSAAEQHTEIEILADGLKSLKDIVKEMNRAERSLPPTLS